MLWLLVAIGYICGALLTILAQEEVKCGRKYLLFFSRIVFFTMAVIMFHPLVLILVFIPYSWEKTEVFIYALASGIIVSLYSDQLIISLAFLLSLVLGSLDKRSIVLFLLGLLPGNIAHF